MAISATHFDILRHMHAECMLPQDCSILEIGEANWYGDFPVEAVFDAAGESCDPNDTFAVAKLIYRAFFGDCHIQAIDAGGPTAIKHDLNEPCRVEQFDVTYNHGTAEHVFNIAQVFRTMHDATRSGGLMLHECPFTGWLDHGFYCLQPTLFFDIAKANSYAIRFMAIQHLASRTWRQVGTREELLEAKRRGELADNLMLFVAMRKCTNNAFRIPIQGVYAGTTSDEAQKAWKALR